MADGLSYLASVLGLATIRTPFQVERSEQKKRGFLWHDVITGLHFLWAHKHLRPLALLGTSSNLFIGASMLAIIVLAHNDLHLTAFMIGLILTVGGVGAVAGAIVVLWLQRHASVSQILFGTILLWVASAALLALAFSPVLVIIGWLLFTLANPIYFAVSFVYRVSLVPDELQGRVNSIYRTMLQAGLALGSALGGLLLSLLDAHLTFWLLALGLLLSLSLIVLTELRHT